jgi:hypothetical protein
MIMNSWYKIKHPKPESVDIEQLKDAVMIDEVAKDLCSNHKVSQRTEKFLDQKMQQIGKDYKDASNFKELQMKIESF